METGRASAHDGHPLTRRPAATPPGCGGQRQEPHATMTCATAPATRRPAASAAGPSPTVTTVSFVRFVSYPCACMAAMAPYERARRLAHRGPLPPAGPAPL